MDFKKKLKIRFYFAVSYIIIGLTMIIVSFIIDGTSEYLSPFGTALLVVGIARARNHFLITKDDETIKKQQIVETDERIISISRKAKSFTLNLYIILACVSVIVLQILKITELATTIGLTVCVLLVIYWISYFVISKKT